MYTPSFGKAMFRFDTMLVATVTVDVVYVRLGYADKNVVVDHRAMTA